MALTVGYAPQQLLVIVSPEAALRFQLQQTDTFGPTNWPTGTVARLEFNHREFNLEAPATVAGPLLSWELTEAETETIPSGCSARIYLDYGDGDFLWLAGKVARRG